jgi:signal peptide peptidase SppA
MSTEMTSELAPLDTSNLVRNGSPLNLEQYLGLWAIEETFFNQQWDMIRRIDLAAHVARSSPRTAAVSSSPDDDGIQIIEIRGTMTKQGSSLSSAGSTVRIRQEVRDAKTNPRVKGVLFVIDSPGGTVAGTAELADDIRALSDVKPTVTLAEDLMASAGMYVGVQSRKVFANVSNAVIGSMGVFIGLYDLSGMAAKEGIKPVIIKTGELKGAGFPGSEITAAQIAMWESLADASFTSFSAAVQKTRKLTAAQLKELSRAGVYPAKQAIDLGLIDGIRSFDAAVAELRSMFSSSGTTASSRMETVIMTTTTNYTTAAKSATDTWNAAVAELTGAGMTKASAINQIVKSRPDLHQAYINEVNGQPATAFETVSTAAANTMTATWNAAIAELTATGMDRSAAIQQLVKSRPDLHQAYINEVQGRA